MHRKKAKGEQEDSKHIAKHKKDVFRLAAMLAPADRFEVPQTLLDDVKRFCEVVKSELPNSDFFKSAGLHNITGEQVLGQLEQSFLIHD